MASKPKVRPVHEVRVGRIRAAIWENDTQNGTRHNVTFARLYKDGNHWKDSTSFGRDDLPLLAKVADLVDVPTPGKRTEAAFRELREALRKVAEGHTDELGDTTTLADPSETGAVRPEIERLPALVLNEPRDTLVQQDALEGLAG